MNASDQNGCELRRPRKKAAARPSTTEIKFQRIITLLEELQAGPRYLKRLMVRENGRFLLIETARIEWIEAQGNYVRVHQGQIQHLIRRRIGRLQSCLDPQVFLRINRSAIINIDRIREVQPVSHGDFKIVMDHGLELMLSRNYRRDFERFLGESA
jgi:two-component system LytT family response regulator